MGGCILILYTWELWEIIYMRFLSSIPGWSFNTHISMVSLTSGHLALPAIICCKMQCYKRCINKTGRSQVSRARNLIYFRANLCTPFSGLLVETRYHSLSMSSLGAAPVAWKIACPRNQQFPCKSRRFHTYSTVALHPKFVSQDKVHLITKTDWLPRSRKYTLEVAEISDPERCLEKLASCYGTLRHLPCT